MQNGQKICFDIIGSFIFELKRNIQMLCFHWKRRNSYVNDLEKKILQSEFTLMFSNQINANISTWSRTWGCEK
uniref:Uncharacterized protein n=1 Tax=Magallana gigas TaxID=29159 RepID=K1R623_MAGGI